MPLILRHIAVGASGCFVARFAEQTNLVWFFVVDHQCILVFVPFDGLPSVAGQRVKTFEPPKVLTI